MRYDDNANGNEIEVGVGQEFEVVLGETRTAGFRWTLKSMGEPACTLIRDGADPNIGAVGGSGKHTWRFCAAQPGAGRIEIAYGRSWKVDAEPERTFLLKVRVPSNES